MILILLGAPGAGKGTQGEKIVTEFGIPSISTGELLRAEVKANSELGQKAKTYMDGGELVPDGLIVAMLEKRVAQSDCAKGYILDGFPRNVAQADILREMMRKADRQVSAVVNVHVDKEIIVERLSNRLSCSQCKMGFNRISKAPKQEGLCDACGGVLVQRDDDKEDTIRHRLTVYEEKTAPLIDYYSKEKALITVDGNRDVDTVYGDVCAKLRALDA